MNGLAGKSFASPDEVRQFQDFGGLKGYAVPAS